MLPCTLIEFNFEFHLNMFLILEIKEVLHNFFNVTLVNKSSAYTLDYLHQKVFHDVLKDKNKPFQFMFVIVETIVLTQSLHRKVYIKSNVTLSH